MDNTSRESERIPALAEWPREFLGQIFERSLNEIYVFDDSSLKFLHVNRGARENLGFSLSDVVEMTPVDIKPEYDEKTFRALVEPLRRSDEVLIFETLHKRKDTTTYPVEVHLQHVSLAESGVFAAIIVDITERKEAESDLREVNKALDLRVADRTHNLRLLNTKLEQRERDLERIFDAAPDAMVLVNRSGEIQRANARAESLFGYGKVEMQGMQIEALIPERFRSTHAAHREDFATSPRVREMGAGMELYARRSDGSEFPIDVNLSPIKFGGQDLVSAAVRDYTEHHAIQAALRKAKEESDRATNAKSRFLATASHDLRQPLQSLGLYLAVLGRQTSDNKALEIVQKMRSSLDAMGSLLDALLDISRFESGSIVPELCDIDVQVLFRQIAAENGPIAADKGLDFELGEAGSVIHSDPALLRRILDNFVSNAIRYTDKGHVNVSCVTGADHAEIRVADTGIGIPSESLDKIFDEYYQLDNQVRARDQGLGIGLAIVKYIAQLLGHELNVESRPEQGSIFSVTVPLAVTSAAGEEPDPAMAAIDSTARECSATVLLVDDDEAIVDATAMLLESDGFKVLTAKDGDAAIARCRDGFCPDFVVSDFRLPGISGIEVIRRIRALFDANLPAILMTGDTAAREIRDAALPHCIVLHKPVDTDRLLSLIHESV